MNTLILGAFRGDEGKGKIVDYYTKYSNKDNEPNVEEFLGDGISYEVFTSKYEKIMKDAINARMSKYPKGSCYSKMMSLKS